MKNKILKHIPVCFILIIGILLCINISYRITVSKSYMNTYTENVIAYIQENNAVIYEYKQIKYSGTLENSVNEKTIPIWINPDNPSQYIEIELSEKLLHTLYILLLASCCLIIGSIIVLIFSKTEKDSKIE